MVWIEPGFCADAEGEDVGVGEGNKNKCGEGEEGAKGEVDDGHAC